MTANQSPDTRVDQLYDLPPGEFTAARNALAKALRAEGQRDDADRVAKLRRPTIAAWAINQAVRHHRDRVDALVDAGAQVGRAQRWVRRRNALPTTRLDPSTGYRRPRRNRPVRLP